jgi:hypothetical protein
MKNYVIPIILLLVVGIISFLVYRSKGNNGPTQFDRLMSNEAEKAVKEAQEKFGIKLDYSLESVENVETILGKYHDDPTLKEAVTNRTPLQYGAYVGEVIRRHKNGKWLAPKGKIEGPMDVQIKYGSGTSFPVNWCGKRVINGEEDNIWHKFTLLVIEDRKALKEN